MRPTKEASCWEPNGTRRPATPKRDRVRRHILDFIDNASPGTSLASERELAVTLGVSRPTVRAAIEELARTGLLDRRHGRGTFTRPNKVTQQLSTTVDGLAVPPAQGDWTSRVITFTITPAGWSRATRLNLQPHDEVLRVTRVRLVDGEPIAIERLELPATLVPGLTPQDMETGDFTNCSASATTSTSPKPYKHSNPASPTPNKQTSSTYHPSSPSCASNAQHTTTPDEQSNTYNPHTAATDTASPQNSTSTTPPVSSDRWHPPYR